MPMYYYPNVQDMMMQVPNAYPPAMHYPMYYPPIQMQPMQNVYNLAPVKPREIDYKPYSLNDYKEKFNSNKKELGGLGPNTGTKEWADKAKKKEKMKEYSKDIKTKQPEPIIVKALAASKKEKPKQNINPLDNSDEINDSMLYDLLDSKVPYERIAKEYNNKKIKEDKESEKIKTVNIAKIQNNIKNEPDFNISSITDKSVNKSGYSHINNIRKLQNDNNSNQTPKLTSDSDTFKSQTPKNKIETKRIKSEKILPQIRERPLSVKKENKIYTTINQPPKLRPISSKAKNIEPEFKNIELENLLQNHQHYKSKIENIRNFINKL
jgi:hypothetical protein